MADGRVDVTVVHLAREQNGLAPLEQFISSYVRFPAGAPHDLRILGKGFDDPADIAAACQRLGRSHEVVCVSDDGMDIGAYLYASRTIETEFVCFLNSFSQICAESWLALMLSAASKSGVGVVAATGSYESALSAWTSTVRPFRRLVPRPWAWPSLTRNLLRWGLRFPVFPNPHVRSNAFLIRTSLFRTMNVRSADKLAALEFESGYRSMSRQVMDSGLSCLLVGANGRSYTVEEWPESATFRSCDQANLLVHDNQTRRYEGANSADRERLGRLAWRARYRP